MTDEERGPEDGASAPRGAGASPPVPARAAMAHSAPAGVPEAAPAELALDAGGRRWIVAELGRARGGPAMSGLPLLLVGFRSVGPGGEERREAWAAAGALTEMTPLQLESLWREARVPRGPWQSKPFFPEVGSRGGRGD